ncbi:hypothetical protein N9Y17_00510 [Gammaproteobacteria bacterium]|nr:hypothetical protein [Gammaproteobacteria bacterium]
MINELDQQKLHRQYKIVKKHLSQEKVIDDFLDRYNKADAVQRNAILYQLTELAPESIQINQQEQKRSQKNQSPSYHWLDGRQAYVRAAKHHIRGEIHQAFDMIVNAQQYSEMNLEDFLLTIKQKPNEPDHSFEIIFFGSLIGISIVGPCVIMMQHHGYLLATTGLSTVILTVFTLGLGLLIGLTSFYAINQKTALETVNDHHEKSSKTVHTERKVNFTPNSSPTDQFSNQSTVKPGT